ncbi:TonB-dependent receptor plug domain-containing protein [Methylobacterium persicinum]
MIGQQQIRDQNAQTLTQATQYVAGAYAGTFGADTRIDYLTLRGFVVSDYGIYRDGLQLLNYGFGYFKVDTFGLERIEILRGPASVLFGAGSPGASSTPSASARRRPRSGMSRWAAAPSARSTAPSTSADRPTRRATGSTA